MVTILLNDKQIKCIQEYKLNQRLTNKELFENTDYSNGYISKTLNGKMRINQEALEAVLWNLKIDKRFFYALKPSYKKLKAQHEKVDADKYIIINPLKWLFYAGEKVDYFVSYGEHLIKTLVFNRYLSNAEKFDNYTQAREIADKFDGIVTTVRRIREELLDAKFSG